MEDRTPGRVAGRVEVATCANYRARARWTQPCPLGRV